ncbi:hypothetical protein EVA_20797 [gut metagenome]|uniref:Uncharacterized protein n=1 Tax=gut metagenome TaxID=749906 RepID=J9F878_9ZZZZ
MLSFETDDIRAATVASCAPAVFSAHRGSKLTHHP